MKRRVFATGPSESVVAMMRRRSTRDVVTVYQALLGREPTDAELERHLQSGAPIGVMARTILNSPEYAGREASHPLINFFSPETRAWTHRPGTRSRDGQCIVGRDGWLFLLDGTNDGFKYFTGRRQVADGWLEHWRELGRERTRDLAAADLSSVWVIVPDKLAVYERFFPDRLDGGSVDRPIRQLLAETDLPIVYPLDSLKAESESREVFLRTDTHLSLWGNDVLQREVLAALGVPPVAFGEFLPLRYPDSGDLGSKFEPKIMELVEGFGHLGDAEVIDTNRDAFEGTGRHVGQRAVFRNRTAPDDRTVVVFGDSYAWSNWSTPGSPWVVGHHQGLTWSLAQTFRETHFVWIPFGWDPVYTEQAGASVVVFETAERFIVSPPAIRSDFQDVSRRALAGPRRIGDS